MNILQLSAHDFKGGASRIAWYLHNSYHHRGHNVTLAVGQKSQVDASIIEIDHKKYQVFPLYWKARHWVDVKQGKENFNFPGSKHIPEMAPDPPDIIHAHNLHGKYFDLRVLPEISMKYPVLLTLHDTWMFTGHCAYFIDCSKWGTGCGKCPDLKRGPAVLRDATAYNWHRKQKIYKKSSLYVVTPSQWLMDRVKESMLWPSIAKTKVINNGTDLSVFKPADKNQLRKTFSIPQNSIVLLYVVSSRLKSNAYKDYTTIDRALNVLQSQLPEDKKVIFLGLGEGGETEHYDNLEKRFVPFKEDITEVAKYYQLADLYIHAARSDNFPNVILEAMSCGTPVIATNVGGIAEQIVHGKTGWLVPPQDYEAMSDMILRMITNVDKQKQMAIDAANTAKKRFSLEEMAEGYLDFYKEVQNDFFNKRHN
ncbi:MAG: glycosyltransferase [Candidatus Helarchaeota archaeon]